MAEAGYCSECGKNVILTPEGECPSGHGAECISHMRVSGEDETSPAAVETGSEGAVPAETPSAPAAAPVAVPEAAPEKPKEFFDEEQPAPATPVSTVTPQRSHSGFIVFVGAALVILIVLVAALLFAPKLLSKGGSTTASSAAATSEKAEVLAAQEFIKALFAADALSMKPFLVDSAQSAITAADWNVVASAIPTVPVHFAPATWSTATTAVTTFTAQDANGTEATGTLVIGSGATTTTPNALSIELGAAGSTETVTAVMTQAGGSWRVVSITDSTGSATVYDAAFVKTMLADAQAAAKQ